MTDSPEHMPMSTVDAQPIGAEDLARACGCRIDWVVRITEIGIVSPPAADRPPADWRFAGTDLKRALEARRLERDFEINLEAVALILDLSQELRRLRATVAAHELKLVLNTLV